MDLAITLFDLDLGQHHFMMSERILKKQSIH